MCGFLEEREQLSMPNPVERPCPECGGQRAVGTVDSVYRLPTYGTDRNFLVVVCTNCGYTSFYANQLGDFAKAWQKNPAAVQKGLQDNAQRLAESQDWRNKK